LTRGSTNRAAKSYNTANAEVTVSFWFFSEISFRPSLKLSRLVRPGENSVAEQRPVLPDVNATPNPQETIKAPRRLKPPARHD